MSVQIFDAEAPVRPGALETFEQELGAPLPEDYRAHLLRHNGGRPEPSTYAVSWPAHAADGLAGWDTGEVHYFYALDGSGSSTDLQSEFGMNRGRIPEDTIAIANDPGGNPLLLGVSGPNHGHVFLLLQHEGSPDQQGRADAWDNVGRVADHFDDFLAGLREGEP